MGNTQQSTLLPVHILGTGLYAPGDAIDNEELMKITGLSFNSEKLESKLGIHRRHIAHLRGINETSADFATAAAQNALRSAGIEADELQLIIVGTDTPEYITPATSILVQGRLQQKEKFAATFDVAASCASFTIALDNAARIMATDASIKYALVVGVYNMPAFFRPDDAFAYSIFADGAGAVILGRINGNQSGYIGSQMLTDGTQYDFIGIYSGASRQPITKQRLTDNEYGLQSLKPMPGDRNVRLWPMIVEKLLKKYSLEADDIAHFVFTQINRSVIENVMDALGQPMSKTTCVMDRYGYTGSACVPMAFHHTLAEDRIKRGDKVIFVASGAGLAVGSNLFIY